MREHDGSRKKVAHAPEAAAAAEQEEDDEDEEKEIDMNNIIAEIKEITETRRKDKQKARANGLRIEKKARMRPRPFCCACEERPGVNRDGTCACGHSRCSECMLLECIMGANH